MKDGFITLGAAHPKVHVADPAANAEEIICCVKEAADADVSVLVLPRLCVTGYTCGDLFYSDALLAAAEDAIARIASASRGIPMLLFVGAPIAAGGALYDCAVAISDGKILGVVPKSHIGADEARYFAPAPDTIMEISLAGEEVSFGADLLFSCREMRSLTVGAEIGEDLFALDSPSAHLAAAGATVMVNLSATAEIISRAERRRRSVAEQSARLTCAYVYAEAGEGESTTDTVFGGHCLIAENGKIVSENPPFGDKLLITRTVDLAHLLADRRRGGFPTEICFSIVPFSLPMRETALPEIDSHPFLPADPAARSERCRDILHIQCRGLAKRMTAARAKGAVIAVSGGLDSCLALLVACRTFDRMGRDHHTIRTVSMPCFGTTQRTKTNAQQLCEELGTDFREIPIAEAVAIHFRDIGHDPSDHSVVYENSQARERTQIIMDLANEDGSLVIGTGDLSELALGWATYNGDHMSNYDVNGGVPKTLVRHLVAYCADEAEADGKTRLAKVLRDILATPVSPELLPAENGEISQKTEDIVGPYDLHDFYLYRLIRYGDRPAKIYRTACAAFEGEYDPDTVRRWLKIFLRRFFTQQFKRSCLPDGPKVGSVGVSPRGDWRMPSDAESRIWLEECEKL